MAVITISRQPGSLGNEITRILCNRLDYKYFDKNLMAQLAAEIGLEPNQVVDLSSDQYHAKSLIERLFGTIQLPFGDPAAAAYLAQENARLALTVTHVRSLIEAAYEQDNIIIVGRGGQIVLANKPDVFHVRVVAPLQTRIKRWQAREGLPHEEAFQNIHERDAAQVDFVRRFFDADITDPALYDLVINTEKLNAEASASLISKGLEYIPRRIEL